MRSEIEKVVYEIKHGIFPPPQDITFEEFVLIEKAVNKSSADKFLLRCYIEKWIYYVVK
jgi:hypothetical protein